MASERVRGSRISSAEVRKEKLIERKRKKLKEGEREELRETKVEEKWFER